MRQAMAQAIRKAVRGSGGRPVAPGNLHVTLAFLGLTPERRLPQLAEVARATALDGAEEPLELSFDHLEYWRAAHLLCAAPAEASERLAALAGRLQSSLAASGFAPDLKPFRPHVTVARKVAHSGPSGEMHPVRWRFTDFALIESRTLPEGALYSVVESYGLCNRRKAANNSKTP
jgi:2'-5' RNA ligase